MNKINESIEYITSKISFTPKIAIILGTGLNDIVKIVKNQITIPYTEIPNFKQSTAPSHQGKLIAGFIANKPVIFMQGRLHYYEGYSMEDITFPIRIFAKMGVKYIFITNAAGSLNKNLLPGNIVMLEDHINFMGTNPLIGKNYDEFGERFPSMHEPYSQKLRKKAYKIAQEENIKLFSGTYAAVTGPSLETRAESLMIKNFGADLVGMSTVPEVITAVHSGIKVFACSIVTNLSNIFHNNPHSQEDIRKNAGKAKQSLKTILTKMIESIEI